MKQLCIALLAAFFTLTGHAQTSISREVLPPAAPAFAGKIGNNYKESTPDFNPALPLKAPEGAANILVVVLDDVGFGQLGAYGGPIDTPNIDRLAAQGLRYNNFHTTALCSPSRAALLTGRNHHAVGMAAITEAATGFPGNYGSIPKSAGTIAEILKQNGYNTFATGKWHLAPYTAYTASGPFDRWPLGMGFEKYYGFLGGETDQWAPLLVQDNSFIETPVRPGYHLSEDLVDRTISYIRDQQQSNTGKPFFAYVALGAAHAPLHAPREYIDKYRGKFDQGWDKLREETFARQKALGIIPANAVLPPRNPGVAAWDSLTPEQRKVYSRLQEVYAGFLDHADHNLGRLFAALDAMQLRDNTLILLVSDNGASQEGLQNGAMNTDRFRNFTPESVPEMLGKLDQAGSAATDPHYPMGWAAAGNSPFKRWKQDTHSGGNTDPLIISWPAKIKDAGAIRSQYHHLVDVMPMLLEAAKVPMPTLINGVAQMPLQGVNMAYTLTEPNTPTKKHVQYYEMLGSRAIWSDGWSAVAWHQKDTPWEADKWELYNTDIDFNQSNDLASQHPEKLAALQQLWQAEAEKYNVLPLDDRRYERAADPTRPVTAIAKREYVFYPGTSILHPLAAPQLNGRAHTISAQVDIPAQGAEGVLACSGGEFGGWSLFIQGGKLHYAHNYLKIEEYLVSSAKAVPAGQHEVSVSFTPTGKSLKPDFFTGDVTLSIDGQQVGELKGIKVARQYSAVTGYGLLIGRNTGTPVSHLYQPPFAFAGGLERVKIQIQ
ncbi:arylsulfatase [Pseudomonas sp. N040]|uniref:arylsulfatase n=1 Tax=Pseudomonas sp. N040 TaxID=2785325 RepID=UPI0018A26472|nr:arylsulfatase [Pseudomonas sp. N040]MBF7729098.1 arylsulfatase [Pseudomonas sp. N040]MBW7012738.1 arylsulfatase [Pseudomonas sp. N040]